MAQELSTNRIKRLCVHHAYKYRYMYWQQNYLYLFFLTKVCFMKITSALIKNLKASTCPWTQHICNAVWRFLSTALKFTPLISRYFMTYLKKNPPHLILLLPGTLSAILCMHDLRRNQYQMYLIRYAAMLLLKTNLYIG